MILRSAGKDCLSFPSEPSVLGVPSSFLRTDLARVIPSVRVLQVAGKFAKAAQTVQDGSTRFFPDSAGEKRFACWQTADKFNWQTGHRIRHVGMDCRHPGPQGRLRRPPCKPGFRHSMPERRYRGERQTPKNHCLRAMTNMLVLVFG